MAGLRTGKIDLLTKVLAEDFEALGKSTPELKSAEYPTTGRNTIYMRNDTKPFDDVRVRQALAMGVNRQEILDLYYEGKADLFAYPVPPIPGMMEFYTPLEQMPESVRELHEYNPDKAKQLLAEAGYPNGFKTTILCTSAEHIDLLSMIKDYWSKIGVDLELDVKAYSVFMSMLMRKTYKQMTIWGAGSLYALNLERPRGKDNLSMISTPWQPKIYSLMCQTFFDFQKRGGCYSTPISELLPDDPAAKGMPSWAVYANEQAWFISLPSPYVYNLWHPWLKNYQGKGNSENWDGEVAYSRMVWIDQELKKAMGH